MFHFVKHLLVLAHTVPSYVFRQLASHIFTHLFTCLFIFFIRVMVISLFPIALFAFMFIQALSKALTDLRADMVAQAQNNVLAHAEETQQERNVQRLIDAHTKDLHVSTLHCSSQPETVWHDNRKRNICILLFDLAFLNIQC